MKALVIVLLVGGAACSDPAPAASDSSAQPTDAADTCRPADLHALFRGFQAARDSLVGAVVVIDGGSDPCTLDGSPRSVSILDDEGDTVAVREHALDVPLNGGAVTLTPGAPLPAFGSPLAAGSAWFSLSWSNWCTDEVPSVSILDDEGDTVVVREHALDVPLNGGAVTLTPGAPLPAFGSPLAAGSAWFSLSWSNWCSDEVPSVRSLLIVLPAGGSITAPIDANIPSWAIGPPTPRCADSHSGSTLSFGRFQPAAAG